MLARFSRGHFLTHIFTELFGSRWFRWNRNLDIELNWIVDYGFEFLATVSFLLTVARTCPDLNRANYQMVDCHGHKHCQTNLNHASIEMDCPLQRHRPWWTTEIKGYLLANLDQKFNEVLVCLSKLSLFGATGMWLTSPIQNIMKTTRKVTSVQRFFLVRVASCTSCTFD